MGLSFEKALGVHPAALKLRAERTKIIASNIANGSTPGYQARDIDFRASLQQAMPGAATAGTVIPGSLSAGSPDLLYRLPTRASQDGNTVVLGTEQAEFSQNTIDFQTSLRFLNMKFKGLQAAITGNV
ncbi:flagellar basal body rod protein FlgB [Paraburkholderia bonniea]|uniref:flagellar basal body rod protein FlgB n=1 Tax=Paraburkholderia bonniea TaxID=2152891 RepID=UPI001291FA1F|nr:flagellar basal body rod protein FlgB [Paraburkholderia bonniea]WJF90789.1 flagellar basal body rod protein FlgB [Paraburkholderia bonniea]WJF94103.1 flagellar basal body rod protein FlgB [Paraburkholderia bonniea]